MAGPGAFHILGAGSVGLLFAHHLRRAALPVTLLLRDGAAVERFRAQGNKITLESASKGPQELVSLDVGAEALDGRHGAAGEQSPISTLVVATKAGDAVQAVRSVQHRLTPGASLVLLQNGVLALYQELHGEALSKPPKPEAPLPRIIIGSVTHGCFTREPFHVVHAGVGTCAWAEVDEQLPTLTHPGQQRVWEQPQSALLQQLLGLPGWHSTHVSSHAELMRQLHLKLAINCCINPLTAVLGCLNGQLAEQAHTRELMQGVCQEVHAVFGEHLSKDLGDLCSSVLKVAVSTAQNKSSMLQDILKGRATEIEFLTGYHLKAAAELKVPVPISTTLYQLVKAKESLQGQAFSPDAGS